MLEASDLKSYLGQLYHTVLTKQYYLPIVGSKNNIIFREKQRSLPLWAYFTNVNFRHYRVEGM